MPRTVGRRTASSEPQITLSSTQSVYVHLCCGDVVTVSPATRLSVQRHQVIIYDGDVAVATYPRREVYLCSKTECSPMLD